MNKNLIWITLVLTIIVLSGCVKTQETTKYVCSDGTTVSDSSFCSKEEAETLKMR
ncbi:MAG: hypothetical protein ABH828_02060 [archaeon]